MPTTTSALGAAVCSRRIGFVTRSRDDLDKRAVRAAITDAGRQVINPATVVVNAVFADPGMTGTDVAKLVELLGSIRAQAGDPVT